MWANAGAVPDDGYGIDVAYIETFFPEQNPAAFSLAAVLHGQPPLDRSRRLSWVDLGCGIGLTACMVAAANADVDVWGCDFNPVHVERSRELAASAGLANCGFDEASFAQLVADATIGPAEIDVAVIHGVYSWVSKENAELIAAFLQRRLRPGGLVFLSHNTAWGWASLAPLAEAMRLYVDVDGRRHDLAFPDAAKAIHALEDGGARFFPVGAEEVGRLRELETANPRYAVHEYLVSHFRPVTFDEVADVMAQARCSFVGSTYTTDHLRELWVPPHLADVIEGVRDPVLLQMLRDLIVQRGFRRDLFRRGLATAGADRRRELVSSLSVVGLGARFSDGDSVHVPAGAIALDPNHYGALLEALAKQPLNLGDILQLNPDMGLAQAAASLAMLIDGGYALPESPGWQSNGSRESARRMNEALIAENRRGASHECLVAPAIGSAVPTEWVETQTLGAVWSGMPQDVGELADEVERRLAMLGWLIREKGSLIDDPAITRTIVERRVASTLERINGDFCRWGIC